MSITIKLCGLKRPNDVEAAIEAGADDLGFIFFPLSPRHVSLEQAPLLRALVPPKLRAVAVAVDATNDEWDAIVAAFRPDVLQLHGDESPERVRDIQARFQRPVMKAIAIRTAMDVQRAAAYAECADTLLFDTKSPDGRTGGTGMVFDWKLLQGFQSPRPWYLSGGLDADNITEALRLTGATCVDASSRLEVRPGEKDAEKMRAFVAAVKAADARSSSAQPT